MSAAVQEPVAIVPFHFGEDTLDVVPGKGEAHIVIRRVCEALGIGAQAQTTKLQTDETFAEGVRRFLIPSDGGPQETFCLDIQMLPLWLAGIHPNKVKATVRPKLIRYKRTCGAVLADHFLGRRRPAPEVTPSEHLEALVVASIRRGKYGHAVAFLNAFRGVGGFTQLDIAFPRSSSSTSTTPRAPAPPSSWPAPLHGVLPAGIPLNMPRIGDVPEGGA